MTNNINNNAIHTADYYFVRAADTTTNDGEGLSVGGSVYYQWYDIVNIASGRVEARTPMLPDAIMIAEQASQALRVKPWEWMFREESPQTEEASASSEDPKLN